MRITDFFPLYPFSASSDNPQKSPMVISETLFIPNKLKEYSYIDDCEYSKRYIDSVSKTQGKRLVEYKLMQKGVKKQDISSAFDDCDIDAKANAKAVAQKYLKNKEITKENIAKTYRYLVGRGFSYDEAGYAIASFNSED